MSLARSVGMEIDRRKALHMIGGSALAGLVVSSTEAAPTITKPGMVPRRKLSKLAADGRFELYKTSKYFDGKPGREQHGFPPPDKAPL